MDDLERIETVLDRAIRSGRLVAKLDGSVHELYPVAIPAREGEQLLRWVEREGAHRTIEVGLGYAMATLFICAGLVANGRAGAQHVALDPHQRRRFSNVGRDLLGEAGLAELVELHEAPSELALPRLVSEGRTFDLGFVDGNHRFEHVFLDLTYLGRLVRGGGVIFLDDHQLPSTRKAVGFFTRNLGWTVEEQGVADPLHHWVVVRTTPVPLERAFDHFVDF
ncbi:MAG: class I SAM-dependent methyltransferase [Elusimicrobia bacterium]|nr:class I SAM-dependent methyltransferase [Elusimicrobiota bacterium]